jgi:hypothetical protein
MYIRNRCTHVGFHGCDMMFRNYHDFGRSIHRSKYERMYERTRTKYLKAKDVKKERQGEEKEKTKTVAANTMIPSHLP